MRRALARRVSQPRGGPPIQLIRARSQRLYGLTGFSSANYYATQNPGGEAGVATGFGAATLFTLSPYSAVNPGLAGRDSGALGWVHYADTGPDLRFSCSNGSTFISAPARRIQPSDHGRIVLHIGVHTGAANLVRSYCDRIEIGAGTAITAFSAAAVEQRIGRTQQAGLTPWPGAILGHMTFRGVPTLAQIQAYYDAVRALGDLPDTIQGATVTHHWSARRTLFGTAPVSGQAAPATLADNITAAAADVMTKQGSPTVAVIDPGIDGRKTYGAQGFSASNYLAAANGLGLRGSASGCWAAVPVCFGSVPTTSQVLVGTTNIAATVGWYIQASNIHTLQTVVKDGVGAAITSNTYNITTADVGQVRLALMHYTGAVLRLYVDAVQQGADVACTGYSVPAGSDAMVVGKWIGGQPFTDGYLLGLVGGAYTLTLAEIQKFFDDYKRTGRIQAIPGKTDHLYDFTTDVLASGQEAVPATVLDRVGTDHLTRQGSGLTLAQRVERVWSYETSPILYGANGFTNSDAYAGSGVPSFVGSAAGFWAAVLLFVELQSGASTRVLFGNYGAGGANVGWLIQALGTNSTLSFVAASGANAAVTSPSQTISAGDVGKLLLAIGVHNGSALQFFCKRVQVGTSTAITGYSSSTSPVNLGRDARVSFGASNLRIFGGAAGLGVPSLAEIQALHDDVMANEDIRPIPGKTDFLASVKRDALANGGVIPTQITDRIGTHHLTKQGSPTLAPQYARAFGW